MQFFRRLFGRPAGVRVYLLGLALLTTLPVTIFAVLVVGELRSNEFEALQRRTTREAEATARLIDRQLHDMALTLRILETSPELPAGDFASFHNRARAALEDSGFFLILVDAAGQQLLNTRVPFGSDLGKTSNPEALAAARSSGDLHVSDLFFGRTGGAWVYNVVKALDLAGRDAPLSLILTQNASDLAALLGHRSMPDGWNAALVDSRGIVIASQRAVEPGEQLPAGILEGARLSRGPARVEHSAGMMFGHARVAAADWEAVIWGPSESAAGPILATWRSLLWAGAAFLLLSLVAALVVGRNLQTTIRKLAKAAHRVGEGEIVSPLRSRIRELDQVSIALSEASFDRHQAQERVQTMLRELSHRTKNIILVAQSMIRQSARHSSDLKSFVDVVTGRMTAFAKSLDLITNRQQGGLSFTELVDTQLSSFLDDNRRMRLDGEDFRLASDVAEDLGMILHELATNALKHGALSTPEGEILLHWRRVERPEEPDRFRLLWEEAGGPEVSEPSSSGFGSSLIRMSAMNLHGSVSKEFRREGVRCLLEFPASRLEEPAS